MTLFLFKAIGLYFVIVGISVLANKKAYLKLTKELSSDQKPMNLMFGFITLIIGILMVLSHNTWNAFPEILVSLYGWIALIKGISILALPSFYQKSVAKMSNEKTLKMIALFYIAFGCYVCYLAF